MPLKCTKKRRSGIYRTQIWPSEHVVVAISSQWLEITGYQDNTVGNASNKQIGNLGVPPG